MLFYVGLSQVTLFKWLNRGEKVKREKYHKFGQIERKRMLHVKLCCYYLSLMSLNGDWKADKYLLECMGLDNYCS